MPGLVYPSNAPLTPNAGWPSPGSSGVRDSAGTTVRDSCRLYCTNGGRRS